MKAINITNEVTKLLESIVTKQASGSSAAQYALDRAIKVNKLQIYKDQDSNVFWLKNNSAPKYAVAFIKTRLKNDLDYVYTESAPKTVDLNKVAKKDLLLFIQEYMPGYKISSRFKAKQLSAKDRQEFFAELHKAYTDGISKIINQFYNGTKPSYRNRDKMTPEERELLDRGAREEFKWFFENLVWLAHPSAQYIQEHKKFSVHNYQILAADLSSCVQNGIYNLRATLYSPLAISH